MLALRGGCGPDTMTLSSPCPPCILSHRRLNLAHYSGIMYKLADGIEVEFGHMWYGERLLLPCSAFALRSTVQVKLK